MSSEALISVKDVSKMYQIYDRPQDRLKQSLWRKKRFYREFWALQDVSFEIKKGETVGIIGRNGSGKSTLLQIIAGTLSSTTGEVSVNGRVAALLELGSGFNPEFTGRENIFLNGAILGINREEMNRRFQDIVEFADIGDFIDQPVKTYSSGMFVRLAFSVAVHSEPDILIVDEALSVGDALFQHKCMAKIKSMVKQGVTLLFVSHSPEAVRSLCEKGIWLQNGKVKMIDKAVNVSNSYLNEVFLEQNRLTVEQIVEDRKNRTELVELTIPTEVEERNVIEEATTDISKSTAVTIDYIEIRNSKGIVVESLEQGEEFSIQIQITPNIKIPNLSIGILINDEFGLELTGESIFNKYKQSLMAEPGKSIVVSFKSKMILRGGQSYSVGVRLNKVSQWDRSDNILLFNDEIAAVFKVVADIKKPMWFKFYQDFEVNVQK
ncbi:ABC transporter ATP-binding protein [Aneurinibacillus aneurinilyticus]|uniref:ABC transporter ATP-binding protein n=1 Tax=Aneurinibacillus aneurinilyticus TaxID=1391 RepID=UPI002E21CDA9|nr:ABC transporter ATP-binding protein [Aneurinibacillus aneurinilyticus]